MVLLSLLHDLTKERQGERLKNHGLKDGTLHRPEPSLHRHSLLPVAWRWVPLRASAVRVSFCRCSNKTLLAHAGITFGLDCGALAGFLAMPSSVFDGMTFCVCRCWHDCMTDAGCVTASKGTSAPMILILELWPFRPTVNCSSTCPALHLRSYALWHPERLPRGTPNLR